MSLWFCYRNISRNQHRFVTLNVCICVKNPIYILSSSLVRIYLFFLLVLHILQTNSSSFSRKTDKDLLPPFPNGTKPISCYNTVHVNNLGLDYVVWLWWWELFCLPFYTWKGFSSWFLQPRWSILRLLLLSLNIVCRFLSLLLLLIRNFFRMGCVCISKICEIHYIHS